MKTIVFSLGGSLIAPDGIDTKFLAGFRRVMLSFVRRGRRGRHRRRGASGAGNSAVIVCGGGNTARQYIDAARRLNPRSSANELDRLGIEATRLNAWLVRDVFGTVAEHRLLYNPTEKIRTRKRIIVGSGWKPGCSTDKDAVLAAKTYGVRTIVNLSNIDYVYDRDPKRFRQARPQPRLTWVQFLRIVGPTWQPGAHVPFDPVASRLARRLKLTLVILNGSNLSNLRRFLAVQRFHGSIIEG